MYLECEPDDIAVKYGFVSWDEMVEQVTVGLYDEPNPDGSFMSPNEYMSSEGFSSFEDMAAFFANH